MYVSYMLTSIADSKSTFQTTMSHFLISKAEGFPNVIKFLLSDSTVIFTSFGFEMVSLSEATTRSSVKAVFFTF